MTRRSRRREPRHRAREAALQLLYQWEVGRLELDEALPTFWAEQGPELDAEHRAFAEALARGVVAHVGALDELIADASEHWRLERLATVDRLILRLAVFELMHHPETPRGVVIDEALEVTRTFSTEEAVKFVNGNLDAIARSLQT